MVALNFDARSVLPLIYSEDVRLLRCNTPRPDLLNEQQIRYSSQLLHDFAEEMAEMKRAAVGLAKNEPGVIYCFMFKNMPDGSKDCIRSLRYKIGEHKRMADDAIYWSQRGYNFYVRASLFRNDLEPGATPEEIDIVLVFALIADQDGEGQLLAGMIPAMTVQTSARNRQYWFLMGAPYRVAFQLGISLRRGTGMDNATGVTVQPYRLPGTVNYPTRDKVEDEDRDAEPTFILEYGNRLQPINELRQILPPCDDLPPNRAALSLGEPSNLTIDQLEAKLRAYYPHKGYNLLIEPTGRLVAKLDRDGRPIPGTENRSHQLWRGIRQGFRAGISRADMHRLILAKYRHGCAIKYWNEHPTETGFTAAIERMVLSAASDFNFEPEAAQIPEGFRNFTVNGKPLGQTLKP
ncbi:MULTISPECIES: DNA-primase RepB domain-containing protein [Mesorhizobium]|uniref:DNA-primase RepB domain-containing protein n=1 Tax=Mesorhizobium TaxID=68287 RepID=UPI001313F260|nr:MULTISPECIES: DNA-primase RepB domain-containing protein [Mesorhizobium]